MDAKQQKQALKEIREAIKNDNNSLAIEKCQELLKEDPKNYMGLVLLGAAYQSSDRVQAALYLRKAVECTPTPTVALQGLANCAPIDELPGIYEQLLVLVPDKACEYYEKLSALGLNEPKVVKKCIKILKTEALKADKSAIKRSSHLNLAKLWHSESYIDESDRKLFNACLEVAIADNSDPKWQVKWFQSYLKFLHNSNDNENLLRTADDMYNLYPDEVSSVEWICRVCAESYRKNPDIASVLSMPVDFYVQKLEELYPASVFLRLWRTIKALEREEVVTAKTLLSKCALINHNYWLALELLARTELLIGSYTKARQVLHSRDEVYAMCLSHSADRNDIKEAIELLLTLEQTDVVLDSLARCYHHLGEKEKLQQLPLTPLLQAKYTLSPQEALELLKTLDDQESYEVLLTQGKLNITLHDYDTALTCMLKATRLKPYRAECFLHLGEIYMALEDSTRARKCFEKCLSLDELCERAVTLLSAVYQDTNQEGLNKALLVGTLAKIPMANSKWVHFKLGLHYLKVKKFDEAIQSFRTSLKLDVSCIVSWECLGDAYTERGSYNSAIRVFQKILELDPGNIVAKLQIATIKMTIRMYREAIQGFDELLTEYPDYLPGLKGAAESHIGLANNLKLERRLGRCKHHLQCAVKYLERAFITGKQDMVWLWRLAANTFVQVALLPSSKAHLEVSGKLAKQSDESTVVLNRKQLMALATRFYACALKLTQNTFLWYELSLCAYYSAKFEIDGAGKHLDLAIKACKMAISAQSDRWHNWNLLGVLNAHKAIHDLPVAQHCFVQALLLERKSYTTWANLGVLYLRLNNIKLANQAFQRAQQSSPIYPNAWIGQAMIAEHIADEEEALDLFRHCQQFEYHLESTLGYAYWVSTILSDEKKCREPKFKRTIDLMYAGTVALDAINWYVAMEEDDCSAEALSYHGFLNARHKLWRPAITGYRQAVKNATGDAKDKLYTNLGYMFLKNNQPREAIDAFNAVSATSFKPIVGLALAYFRAGLHQEAYHVYSSVLQNLNSVEGSDDTKAALIPVAMASIMYALEGEANTKTILYQCILLQNSPIEALYSACALGILHHDNQLTETILEELKKYERSIEFCAHIAFLTSQYHLSNNQTRKGLTYLISRVHMYPQCAELRKVLANYLLENYGQMNKYFLAISQIALSAIALGHSSTNKNSCIEDAKSLLTASKALKAIDKRRSKNLIQRAIHLYPQSREAWSALAPPQ